MVAAITVGAPPTTAQTPSADANRRAYEVTIRCFVGNVVGAGLRRERGDQLGAARYESAGQTAFNASLRMGQVLNRTQQQVQDDIDAATRREMQRMLDDPAYLGAVVGECRSLGLMAS